MFFNKIYLCLILLTIILINNCCNTVEIIKNNCLISNVTKHFGNKTIKTNSSQYYNKYEYVQIYNQELNELTYFNKSCYCENKICVRKCCSEYQWHLKNDSKLQCVTQPNKNNLTKLNIEFYNENQLISDINDTAIHVISGNPCVYEKYQLTPGYDLYYLQSDGLLFLKEDEDQPEYLKQTWNEYCMEIRSLDEGTTQVDYFLCFGEENPEEIMVKPFAIGMIISIPFLFLTFAVYAIIPELQNLHGKSLMCYVFTLMIAYILLAFIQLSPTHEAPFCEIVAFCIYYFFLVSFFWLNVMCFDIWWTFSGFRGFKSSFRNAEQKKFFFYHLYAWGVPSAILSCSLIMQFHPSVPSHWITPNFGFSSCWFKEKEATLLYFHLPLFFVIACNVCLFISTAVKIIKIKRDTAMLKTKDSKRHENSNYTKDKQRFALYLKLFIVMGVNWTMELISVIFEDPNDPNQQYAWILTDLSNTLHGVLIFIIFVCKRQIWALLVKRYHVMMGRPYQANAAFSRTQTTSYSVSQSTDTTVSQHGSIKLNNFN